MNLLYREAQESDLEALISLLADDQLGSDRENTATPLDPNYRNAFQSINLDPNNELVVVESGNKIIGMLQLTFIPYLSHQGAWRCLVECVRVHKKFRGQGFGTELLHWAIARAKQKKCFMVQLTSNKQRINALRFYQQLGFTASHEGFKLVLNQAT